jgi:hypothetical protein
VLKDLKEKIRTVVSDRLVADGNGGPSVSVWCGF